MKQSKSISIPYAVFGSVYCVLLLLDTLLEVKIVELFGLQVTLGTAVIALVYVCSDCLVEVYGFNRARIIMWVGFFILFLSSVILKASCYVPSIEGWEGNEHFNYIYNLSPRVAIACLFAYLFGSYTNNYVISKLKVMFKGKYFKTRAMVSTIAGESIDAVIGTFGIFFGLLPLSSIISIMISMAVLKCCIEACILPITSQIVKKLSKEKEIYGSDKDAKYTIFGYILQ